MSSGTKAGTRKEGGATRNWGALVATSGEWVTRPQGFQMACQEWERCTELRAQVGHGELCPRHRAGAGSGSRGTGSRSPGWQASTQGLAVSQWPTHEMSPGQGSRGVPPSGHNSFISMSSGLGGQAPTPNPICT